MSQTLDILNKCKSAPYFGANGLTSTSANFIANKAKEMFEAIESENKNYLFLNTEYKVFGKDPVLVNGNADENTFTKIKDNLKRVGKLKALIAWLREGIKLKRDTNELLNLYSIGEYCMDNGIKAPESPRQEYANEDKVKALIFDTDRSQKYLQLEAEAANLGSFIHKNGTLSEARKIFNELAGKTKVNGNGNETTFVTYLPTIDPSVFEKNFMELQEMHRSVQAELNGMKHEVEIKMNELDHELKSKYRKEYQEYQEQNNKLNNDKDDFVKKESQEVANLKIIIPDNLKSIYDLVNKG